MLIPSSMNDLAHNPTLSTRAYVYTQLIYNMF